MEIDREKIRKQNRKLNWIIIAAVVFVGAALTLSAVMGSRVDAKKIAGLSRKGGLFSSASSGDRVGVLYISGVIHSGRSGAGGFMGSRTSGSDSIVSMIENAAVDPGVKALVVRINSPGGSAAGSQEIYDALLRFKQKKKPVIISMGDVAASGGYYIAAAGDTIFADPATLTGSIGVIFSLVGYEELFKKVGLDSNVIKSVEHKDIGSPYRPMTEEERQILQGAVDNIHSQFISHVAKGRGMDIEEVSKLADGRLYTGEQALGNKLVDKMGGMHEAVEFAAKKAGMPSSPKLEYLQKENPFMSLFETASEIGSGVLANKIAEAAAKQMLAAPGIETR
ncbi:MAG: putative signal peptide peptidase SppA [bacterium ADurb.Bin236]|nr:MAG: putative signal peptide peptidase SppA [bacterium ADurb.Bin236]HOY61964.1 signal peptide peptidase SppA [bacterium]HPN94837.1 signal peptide peptidase SppA [bacterium]